MFVPEDCLKINLPGLVEKAISKWSESQPPGFTRPLVERCGDFIAAEMNSRNLRCLVLNEPLFNKEATPEEFRECVFAALDHWLVQAESSGEPMPEQVGDESGVPGPAAPFSEPSGRGTPPVDPYYAFNESWGPAMTRRKSRGPAKIKVPTFEATSRERIPGWLYVVLAIAGVLLLVWLFR